MDLALHFLILAAGVAVLVKSADWFTEAAIDTAHKAHVPEIVVGATLVSLATTLPEFAVSFLAVWQGKIDITVGNAIGSTICNVGLILGLCVVLAPMAVARKGFLNNGLILLVLGALFCALGYRFPGGSRITGLAMMAGLVAYLAVAARTTRAHRADTEPVAHTVSRRTHHIAALFVVGAVGVVAGSKLMVYAAEHLARAAGISELAISLTLVAFGTSTPELVVCLTGIIKKRQALSIGNIIGANILNLAWVIGSCSLVRPLPLRRQTLIFDLPTMMILSALLLIFGLTGSRFTRLEGAILFALYAAYLVGVFVLFAAPGAPG